MLYVLNNLFIPSGHVNRKFVYQLSNDVFLEVDIYGKTTDVDEVFTKLKCINRTVLDLPRIYLYDAYTGIPISKPLFVTNGFITTKQYKKDTIEVNITGKESMVDHVIKFLKDVDNKWKYIVTDKEVLLDDNKGNLYSGSGVLLIETNTNSIILIKSNSPRSKIEDMGGRLDIHSSCYASEENLKMNAIKEVLEESQNLFNLKNANFNNSLDLHYDSTDNKKIYKCYIVPIKITIDDINTLSTYFNENKELLKEYGPEYNESVDLILIKKDDLQGYINAEPTRIGGTNIRDRTIQIFKKFLEETDPNYEELKKASIELKLQDTKKIKFISDKQKQEVNKYMYL